MSATRPQPMASGYWYALQIYEIFLLIVELIRGKMQKFIFSSPPLQPVLPTGCRARRAWGSEI